MSPFSSLPWQRDNAQFPLADLPVSKQDGERPTGSEWTLLEPEIYEEEAWDPVDSEFSPIAQIQSLKVLDLVELDALDAARASFEPEDKAHAAWTEDVAVGFWPDNLNLKRGRDVCWTLSSNDISSLATKTSLEEFGWNEHLVNDAALQSIVAVGLGHRSHYFHFDTQTRSFVQSRDLVLDTDLDVSSIQLLVNDVIECGNAIRELRVYSEVICAGDAAAPSSSQIALARALACTTAATEEYVYERLYALGGNVGELAEIFQRPRQAVRHLRHWLALTRTNSPDTDIASLLWSTYEQDGQQNEPHITDILKAVFVRLSEPGLSQLARDAGLDFSVSFVEPLLRSGDVSPGESAPAGDSNPEKSYIDRNTFGLLTEIAGLRNMIFKDVPLHPLLQPRLYNLKVSDPKFWINRSSVGGCPIHAEAEKYEESLEAAVNLFERRGCPSPMVETSIVNQLTHAEDPQMSMLAGDLLQDEILRAYRESSGSQGYPSGQRVREEIDLDIINDDFRALVSAQARVANTVCLRLLFTKHELTWHLSVLSRLALMGDGLFICKIKDAIFPVSRWGQPESLETRAALMDAFAEQYRSDSRGKAAWSNERHFKSSENGLSFATSTVNEANQAFKDPYDLRAYDFLELRYTSGPLVKSIITPEAMEVYNRIFSFLLKVVRVQHLATRFRVSTDTPRRHVGHSSAISTMCTQFRHQAAVTANALLSYSTFYAVQVPAQRFQANLRAFEQALASEATPVGDSMGRVSTIHALRQSHEEFLSQVCEALMLNNEYEDIFSHMEHLLAAVLRFTYLDQLQHDEELWQQDAQAASSSEQDHVREGEREYELRKCTTNFQVSLDRLLQTLEEAGAQQWAAEQTNSYKATGPTETLSRWANLNMLQEMLELCAI